VCVVGDVICLVNKTKFTTTLSYNRNTYTRCGGGGEAKIINLNLESDDIGRSWCNCKALGLYSGSVRFESQQRCYFSDCLAANTGII
jgi:hypothetical protein